MSSGQDRPTKWLGSASGLIATALLVLPAIAFIAGERGRPAQNRPLADLPTFTEGWNSLDQLARYLDDRMPLRSQAIQLDSWIDRNVFTEDPAFGGASSPLVVQGRNGFAFLAEDFEIACTPTGTIEQSLSAFESLETLLTSTDRRFIVSLAPNKSTILMDEVPDDLALRPCWKSYTDILWKSLRSINSETFVDLRKELEESDLFGDRNLYFKTDSHWSSAGSLVAVRAVLSALSPEVWRESDVQKPVLRDYTGDLSLLEGSQRSESIAFYEVARQDITESRRTILNSKLKNTNFRFRNVGPEGTLIKGRALLISDSFGEVSLDRISPFFEDLTFIHFGDWDPELFALQMEQADTIWILTAERYFTWRFSSFLGDPTFVDSLESLLGGSEK